MRAFVLASAGTALIAVGVHAATDLVDDRFVVLADLLDAWADGWWARWATTAQLVDTVSGADRAMVATVLALVWELIVDVFAFLALAWPADEPKSLKVASALRTVLAVAVAGFVIAGAVIVGQTTDAACFAALVQLPLEPATVELLSRALGAAAGLLVALVIGWQVIRHTQLRADSGVAPWAIFVSTPLLVALTLEVPPWLAATHLFE